MKDFHSLCAVAKSQSQFTRDANVLFGFDSFLLMSGNPYYRDQKLPPHCACTITDKCGCHCIVEAELI